MNRALFIHGGALGDFVMALRVVQTLRAYCISHVDALIRGAHATLARKCGAIDNAIDLDCGGWHTLFGRAFISPEISVMIGKYDLVVNMLPSNAVRDHVGRVAETRYIEIDPQPRLDSQIHISDQWLGDLKAHGFNVLDDPPNIRLDEIAVLEGRELLARQDVHGNVVVIHPGSGGRHKCYPLAELIELAKLLRTGKFSPVFVLGEVELERMEKGQLDALRQRFAVIDGLTLTQLATVLSAADVYVGNDSGVSHLAAALGTPTIAIFGATNPALWAPLGPAVRILGEGRAWPTHRSLFESIAAILDFEDREAGLK